MRNQIPATISIDPQGARDLDDALAVTRLDDGGWRLDVLIPDVPSLVPRGSDADVEARRLGLTSYGASGIRVPMLPIPLVDALSLSPVEDRPIVHIEIAIDATLRPTVTSIASATGRTAAALTYAQADAALDNAAHPHHAAVAHLWNLARRLAEDRAAAIGADFDDTGTTWISEEGSVILAGVQRAHRSNILVMEIMILVNTALARHARDKGVTILYRNHVIEGLSHGDRASASLELAAKESIGKHVAAKRLRAMSHLARQATIGTVPSGHHGLDADCYAWFTSPLRRYADLVSLRALVHGEADEDLETLASRLTGVHRSQIESGDEHHGKSSRQRLLPLLRKGEHEELDGTSLHVIIRALVENPGFDKESALRHIGLRMAGDQLSGRDIAALIDHVATLFGDDVVAMVTDWIGNGARALLLGEHRDGITTFSSVQRINENNKGRLLEMAQAQRAHVTFSDAVRTGTAHAPVFTVTTTWRQGDKTLEANGMERTIRNAEQAAAAAMIEKVGAKSRDTTDDTSWTPPGESPPMHAVQTVVAHKTRLIEVATATGATVKFGEARMSGPPHTPTFSVEVRYRHRGKDMTAHGEATNKREAERRASEAMLGKIGNLPK